MSQSTQVDIDPIISYRQLQMTHRHYGRMLSRDTMRLVPSRFARGFLRVLQGVVTFPPASPVEEDPQLLRWPRASAPVPAITVGVEVRVEIDVWAHIMTAFAAAGVLWVAAHNLGSRPRPREKGEGDVGDATASRNVWPPRPYPPPLFLMEISRPRT